MFNSNQKLFSKDKKLKQILDDYAFKYDSISFLKDDPSMFLHLYNDAINIEIAGFIASLFSYGKRDLFINHLKSFLTVDKDLKSFILNFDENDDFLKNFNYRFSKGVDFIQVLKILKKIYSNNESIGSLFKYYYEQNCNIVAMMQGVIDYFYSNVSLNVTKGFYHLLPNPSNGGAMKRMNMLLRWFVRKSPVDIGIWNFIDKSQLIIPLDVHVGNISRQIGLLNRRNNDMKSAIEITNNLKYFDSDDPVKYDFALFGIGVNGINL